MDIFAEARQRVSAEDAARLYGVEIDRQGRALCPFHPDRKPSMSFHKGRFKCWACNAGGSSVDFVARLLDLDAMGAVRRLNEDFLLGLPMDRPATARERTEAAKRREMDSLHAEFERWRDSTLRELCACLRHAHRLNPDSWDAMTDGDVLAVGWKDGINAWAEALANGTAEEQMKVFRQRNEVELLTKQILASSRTKCGKGLA